MATVEELFNRELSTGNNARAIYRYHVTGATGDDDAISAVETASTSTVTINGQSLTRRSIRPRILNNVSGDFTYNVDVIYSRSIPPAIPDPGDDEIGAFDIGTRQENISQSLSTESAYGGGGVNDYEGAINVQRRGDGSHDVAGTDILVPELRFSRTHVFSDTAVDNAFQRDIASATGTVNQLAFRGYDPGELLFLGATGQQRDDENWEITYRFAVSFNQVGLSLGGFTINKDGWDYLWFAYRDEVQGTQVLPRPYAAYVERVYQRTDFASLLGI